jgi:hypothetical protein
MLTAFTVSNFIIQASLYSGVPPSGVMNAVDTVRMADMMNMMK